MSKTGQYVWLAGVVAFAALPFLAPAVSARPQAAAPKGNATTGKTLYASKMCNQCHGPAGGGTDAAPRIAGYPLPFTDFQRQVREPANKMPAFDSSSVSDAELANMYAFLESTLAAPAPAASRPATAAAQAAPPAPAATAASLGPGNAQNGGRIFVAYGCYECHNRAANGSAATGPRLGPNPISVEAMIHELRHPNEMPPYTERVISDAEINDIHAYLASLPPPPNPNSIPLLSR